MIGLKIACFGYLGSGKGLHSVIQYRNLNPEGMFDINNEANNGDVTWYVHLKGDRGPQIRGLCRPVVDGLKKVLGLAARGAGVDRIGTAGDAIND